MFQVSLADFGCSGEPGDKSMQVDFDQSGEVCGLMPTPINANMMTGGRVSFCAYLTDEQPPADLYVRLQGADDTTYTKTFENAMPVGAGQSGWKNFNFTVELGEFPAIKYCRAIYLGITLKEY